MLLRRSTVLLLLLLRCAILGLLTGWCAVCWMRRRAVSSSPA